MQLVISQDEYQELSELLNEIENKIGPYKMDNHEHALSVMGNNSKNAKRIREILSIDYTGERLQ